MSYIINYLYEEIIMNLKEDTLEKLARQFKILGDKTRLKIVMLLQNNELPVNKIVEQSGTTQANISKHLKILFKSGILKKRQNKSSVLYSIKKACIFEICDILNSSNKNPAESPIKIIDNNSASHTNIYQHDK